MSRCRYFLWIPEHDVRKAIKSLLSMGLLSLTSMVALEVYQDPPATGPRVTEDVLLVLGATK